MSFTRRNRKGGKTGYMPELPPFALFRMISAVLFLFDKNERSNQSCTRNCKECDPQRQVCSVSSLRHFVRFGCCASLSGSARLFWWYRLSRGARLPESFRLPSLVGCTWNIWHVWSDGCTWNLWCIWCICAVRSTWLRRSIGCPLHYRCIIIDNGEFVTVPSQ